jgi:hypothetical protein
MNIFGKVVVKTPGGGTDEAMHSGTPFGIVRQTTSPTLGILGFINEQPSIKSLLQSGARLKAISKHIVDPSAQALDMNDDVIDRAQAIITIPHKFIGINSSRHVIKIEALEQKNGFHGNEEYRLQIWGPKVLGLFRRPQTCDLIVNKAEDLKTLMELHIGQGVLKHIRA